MKTYKSNNLHRFTGRTAFTMIELVFVIVILGILAALAMPRLERDLKQEAAASILSDIRYTQHLALLDSKQNFSNAANNATWQRSFWRIGFENCSGTSGLYEYIGSDMNYGGGIDDHEAAIDPANRKKMIWTGADCSNGGDSNTSDRIFITHKFGIKSFSSAGGCPNGGAKYIGFDHLGRLHQGFAGAAGSSTPDYSTYISTACTLTFTMSDNDTFAITIQPETGHAFIVGQPDS